MRTTNVKILLRMVATFKENTCCSEKSLHLLCYSYPSFVINTRMKSIPYEENNQPDNKISDPSVSYTLNGLSLDPNKLYTYADYLNWFDNIRRELINGMVRLMSGPNTIHSRITTGLVSTIWSFIKKRRAKCEIFHAPIDVRLPKGGETANDKIFTVLQPDICVVCDPSKIDQRGIIGAPDLVVEVQSPSTAKYVMSKKFDIYEEAGVKEYWVVYPNAGLTIFLLQDSGKYDAGTNYDIVFMPDAKVPVHTIEGLEIELKVLFE